MMGTIYCNNIEEFAALVAELVKQGLTFEGRLSDLTITLTGGY
jgi:hypothetical protein